MHYCKTCDTEKLNSEFYFNKTKAKLENSCKGCFVKRANEYQKKHSAQSNINSMKWAKKNKQKVKIKQDQWKEINKDHIENRRLQHSFSISLADYNSMFESQAGCCKICKRHQVEIKRKLFVDHDHTTGKVRGLLCLRCNSGLGMFKDDIDFLETAIVYLKDNSNARN